MIYLNLKSQNLYSNGITIFRSSTISESKPSRNAQLKILIRLTIAIFPKLDQIHRLQEIY